MALLDWPRATVDDLANDDEIIDVCKKATVTGIDAPLSMSKGFRAVDKQMIRMGFRVLPPSWMKTLTLRAISLCSHIPMCIETHPTSSAKNMGLKIEVRPKDHLDAVLAALAAFAFNKDESLEVMGEDGSIYLVPPSYTVEVTGKNSFLITERRVNPSQ